MLLFVGSMAASAKTNDSVVVVIGGETVSRTVFADAYRRYKKAWADHVLKQRKETGRQSGFDTPMRSPREYLEEVYVIDRLKVRAAKDAQLDTLADFRHRLAVAMGHSHVPAVIISQDVEDEARKRYETYRQQTEKAGGAALTRQILLAVGQQAPASVLRQAERRADSIVQALKHGADFETLARKCSDDRQTRDLGGLMPWIVPGQMVKAYDDVAFHAKVGETSKPVLSEYGYHIIRVEDRQKSLPYDSLRDELCRYVEAKKIRASLTTVSKDELALMKPVRNDYKQEISYEEALKAVAHNARQRQRLQEIYEQMLIADIERSTLGVQEESTAKTAADKRRAKAEKKWLKTLRKKYKVSVNKKALATIR